MSKYQPPHARGTARETAGESSGAGARWGNTSGSSPLASSSGMKSRWAPAAAQAQPIVVPGPQPVSSRWAPNVPSTTYALASPASDLKPKRLATEWAKPSEMEMLASVSRSGGDGMEGDALKNSDTQHAFRRYIDERLAKHHARFSTLPHEAPLPTSSEELESLKSVVLLFRKLREGITAAHRIDNFAIEVYESSALLAILAHDASQLNSTLSVLVPGLYSAHDEKRKESLEQATGSLSLGPDRRALFTSLFLLYHICHLDSQTAFWNHYRQLTAAGTPFASSATLVKSAKAADALSPRFPKPRLFFAVMRQGDDVYSSYERIMLSWAQERVRERSLAVLRKAYLDAGDAWVLSILGFDLDEEEGRQWLKRQGLRVEAGKVKLRP